MRSGPFITGIGLATPLGTTRDATWKSLCNGKSITDHSRVADLQCVSEARVNALARVVAREAVADAGWSEEEMRSVPLIVGTSKGPMDAWLEGSSLSSTLGLAESASVIAADLRMIGPRLTVSGACASGLLALIRAAMMIRAGEARRALVVAAESSLHPLFIGSFARLGVLAPKGFGCRPFDKNRSGFVVSEAAAAVCLESETLARRSAGRCIAIERFAMGADAAHLTGADPNAVSLRRVLRHLVVDCALDLVHAHGTGTIANDPLELNAIEAALQRNPTNARPGLYSHKAALGHSLGAAGLVAIVINALCHRRGAIPPNVHTRDPLTCERMLIARGTQIRRVQRSLAVAAGFGGAIAGVTLVSEG